MKRLLSLAVSLLILAIIYWRIDVGRLLGVFQRSHLGWMAFSLGMVVPITGMTAWRLQQLMPDGGKKKEERGKRKERNIAGVEMPGRLGWGEATRLILAASTLNMVLPSKMGDIAKAYFMQQKGHLSGSLALALVIFEKACDMLALLLWCAFGLLLYPQKDGLFWGMTVAVSGGLLLGGLLLGSPKLAEVFFTGLQGLLPVALRGKVNRLQQAWQEMHGYFWGDRRHQFKIALTSICIWWLHLLQIWLFTKALNATVPFLANLALSPLAILAGLLPLTFAGVGTRDAALIVFYQPYLDGATAAALGVLCTSRYLMPAIAGLPFLNQYLASLKQFRQNSHL
jgi:glycosyltransferase 2 family protein